MSDLSFCPPSPPTHTHTHTHTHTYPEHMLFMGSTKYPDENSFDGFVRKHGGDDNASTDCEWTIFQVRVCVCVCLCLCVCCVCLVSVCVCVWACVLFL